MPNRTLAGDFPGGPEVKTPYFHFRAMGSIHGGGPKDPTGCIVQKKQQQPKGHKTQAGLESMLEAFFFKS